MGSIRHKAVQGFSLIELMISLGILTILGAGIMSMNKQVGVMNMSSESSMNTTNQARHTQLLIDTISRSPGYPDALCSTNHLPGKILVPDSNDPQKFTVDLNQLNKPAGGGTILRENEEIVPGSGMRVKDIHLILRGNINTGPLVTSVEYKINKLVRGQNRAPGAADTTLNVPLNVVVTPRESGTNHVVDSCDYETPPSGGGTEGSCKRGEFLFGINSTGPLCAKAAQRPDNEVTGWDDGHLQTTWGPRGWTFVCPADARELYGIAQVRTGTWDPKALCRDPDDTHHEVAPQIRVTNSGRDDSQNPSWGNPASGWELKCANDEALGAIFQATTAGRTPGIVCVKKDANGSLKVQIDPQANPNTLVSDSNKRVLTASPGGSNMHSFVQEFNTFIVTCTKTVRDLSTGMRFYRTGDTNHFELNCSGP